MDDQEFEARLRAFDVRHEQFLDQLGAFDQQLRDSDQRFRESTRLFDERLEESGRRFRESTLEFNERLEESDRRFQESDRRFRERLDLYDQRDTALLQRLERLREQVDLLSGQSGQITDDLVQHKRDPDAHA